MAVVVMVAIMALNLSLPMRIRILWHSFPFLGAPGAHIAVQLSLPMCAGRAYCVTAWARVLCHSFPFLCAPGAQTVAQLSLPMRAWRAHCGTAFPCYARLARKLRYSFPSYARLARQNTVGLAASAGGRRQAGGRGLAGGRGQAGSGSTTIARQMMLLPLILFDCLNLQQQQ